MKIPITIGKKQLYIGSDENQYFLGPERIAKDGSVVIAGQQFYSSLSALFSSLIHQKIRAADVRTLEELRATIIRAEREIMEAFDIDRLADSMARAVTAAKGGRSGSRA